MEIEKVYPEVVNQLNDEQKHDIVLNNLFNELDKIPKDFKY